MIAKKINDNTFELYETQVIKTSDTEYNIVITPTVEPIIVNRSITMVNKDIEDKEKEILEVEAFLETKRQELVDLIAERDEAIAKGVINN